MNLEKLMKDHHESRIKGAIRSMMRMYNYKHGPQTVKPIYECQHRKKSEQKEAFSGYRKE